MKKEPVVASTLETSPYKSAVEELDTLRKTFRLACQHYAKRIDMEIIRLRERVVNAGDVSKLPAGKTKPRNGVNRGRPAAGPNAQVYDLRDMLTLLRTLEVKPVAGRRKDLKKIEALVDDLRILIERWA